MIHIAAAVKILFLFGVAEADPGHLRLAGLSPPISRQECAYLGHQATPGFTIPISRQREIISHIYNELGPNGENANIGFVYNGDRCHVKVIP